MKKLPAIFRDSVILHIRQIASVIFFCLQAATICSCASTLYFTNAAKTMGATFKEGSSLVEIRSSSTGKIVLSIDNIDPISHALYSPNNEFIALSSANKILRIWDANNGSLISEHSTAVPNKFLLWSPDSKKILSSSDEDNRQSIDICDVLDQNLDTNIRVDTPMLQYRFYPESDRIMGRTNTNEVIVWEVSNGGFLFKMESEDALTPIRQSIVPPNAIFIDVLSIIPIKEKVIQFNGTYSKVRSINNWGFSNNKKYFATATTEEIWNDEYSVDRRKVWPPSDILKIWDAETGDLLFLFNDGYKYKWAETNRTWAELQTDISVSTLFRELSDSYLFNTKGAGSFSFSPDDTLIAAAPQGNAVDNWVTLWNLETGRKLWTTSIDFDSSDFKKSINGIRFSDDGKIITVTYNLVGSTGGHIIKPAKIDTATGLIIE